jgi:hypothetical protein
MVALSAGRQQLFDCREQIVCSYRDVADQRRAVVNTLPTLALSLRMSMNARVARNDSPASWAVACADVDDDIDVRRICQRLDASAGMLPTQSGCCCGSSRATSAPASPVPEQLCSCPTLSNALPCTISVADDEQRPPASTSNLRRAPLPPVRANAHTRSI